MTDKSILLIDDDEELCELLTDFLKREGFQVGTAGTGRKGIELASTGKHCLVLLDIMLPDLDGFEVLKELRKTTTIPVIMLTARGEEIDRIVGLELGADDYLPKPFNPRELTARMKAVLRRMENPHFRNGQADPPEKLSFGDLTIDLAGYRALLAGSDLELTTIEFALLRELAGEAGRVLSRDSLLDRIRGRDFEFFDRSIDVHISHLRQKLKDNPSNPRFIKTVRSVGYMFIGGDF